MIAAREESHRGYMARTNSGGDGGGGPPQQRQQQRQDGYSFGANQAVNKGSSNAYVQRRRQ